MACERTKAIVPAMQEPTWRLIDLFCGAGGMTLGFVRSGCFRPVWANDFNRYAVETYRRNFGPHVVAGDIIEIFQEPGVVPQAELVIGGPPCQGFSLLNKNRLGDGRRELWRPFMEVVERSGARAFVIENVPQLLGTLEHELILETARNQGFEVASAVLCAADYGVPQKRFRAFLVGSREVDPNLFFPPLRSHFDPAVQREERLLPEAVGYRNSAGLWRTVRDAIGDLPPRPEGTEIRDEDPPLDLHFGRSPTAKSLARYRAIPEEGMNRFDLQERAPELTPACWIRKTKGGTDLFGRLWWDRPAFTIRTEFYKPEKGRYLHPEQHRPITHREAARLQSFPDDFSFQGSKIEIAKQIGNAVPPALASAVAGAVTDIFLCADEKQGVESAVV
jgi:DNA (cytosine-5)-methyltransferase 1